MKTNKEEYIKHTFSIRKSQLEKLHELKKSHNKGKRRYQKIYISGLVEEAIDLLIDKIESIKADSESFSSQEYLDKGEGKKVEGSSDKGG